jgi:hypothetical protein
MAIFRKKADPISDRARSLNNEIAALQVEIKKLDTQLQQSQPAPENPRLRSTARPHGAVPHRMPEHPNPGLGPVAVTARPRVEVDAKEVSALRAIVHEPVFEEVDLERLTTRVENRVPPDHYNELGVRKYDLPALLQRIRNLFRGPSTTNPKLVNYLAAGGIQGLRPMRYEKRVARNRFVALVVFLFIILLGIILAFVKHH